MFDSIYKKIIGCALIAALFAAPFAVNAADAQTEQTEQTVQTENTEQTEKTTAPADEIDKIAETIDVYGRYENVDKAYLYKKAMETVLESNPELYEPILKKMLESVDENSVYFNESESKKLFDQLTDEIVGIGVNVISSGGNIIVTQPVAGSPADKAGIRPGDIIVGADDVDLYGMDLDTAVEHIRGIAGTTVNVRIKRSGVEGELSFPLVRQEVVSNPVSYEKIEEDGKKIAKISISTFSDTVLEHFTEALGKADKAGIKNIIIDLRNNGGGYLAQAVGIADLFLPKDALITTEDHKYSVFNREYRASGKGKEYNTVILINERSASASEVLTAALKENNRAKVIGKRSFGKGTVQSIANLPRGSVMKYTSAYYLTPLGNNIHKQGIAPDATVENTTKPIDMSEFKNFSLKKAYMAGDRGAEVEMAKKMLEKLGLFVGEINGVYDENLKTAVYSYQKAEGLFPYGVLDITTQYRMYDTLQNAREEVDDQLRAAIDAF